MPIEPGLAITNDIEDGRRGLRSGNGIAGPATACWVASGAGEGRLVVSCGAGTVPSVCGAGFAGAAGLRSGRGTTVLLAMVDDFDFAFEATDFLLTWALACFETDLAAGSADAPLPMQRQAMHASNVRALAQKRLIRRPVPVLRSCSD